MKILLVDDDSVARGILSALLQQQGHEVVEATDGELAWKLVKDGDISFIVSDWLMPHLAGVDLCRKIRAAGFDRYIYVILCTSKGARSDLIEGMDAGADDFLVKPISPEELRVKVRAGERVLSLQQGLAEKKPRAGKDQLLARGCASTAGEGPASRSMDAEKAVAFARRHGARPPLRMAAPAVRLCCRRYIQPVCHRRTSGRLLPAGCFRSRSSGGHAVRYPEHDVDSR